MCSVDLGKTDLVTFKDIYTISLNFGSSFVNKIGLVPNPNPRDLVRLVGLLACSHFSSSFQKISLELTSGLCDKDTDYLSLPSLSHLQECL